MDHDATDIAHADLAALYPDRDLTGLDIGMRILRVASLLRHDIDRVLAATPLRNKGDYDTLLLLRRCGTMTPTAMREELLVTSAGMTARLDRLEAGGYLERRSSGGDRRSIHVELTESGVELADAISERIHQRYTAIVGDLDTKTRHALIAGLRAMAVSLGDSRHEPAAAPSD